MAVPPKIKEALEFICAAAGAGDLAALEVKQVSDGEPAFLLVAVRKAEDGEFDIAPLARIDVDFMTDFMNPSDEKEEE